ncbi:O-antigen ligase family protein [Natrarchaeobius oligotrophus]|uniref:O-antigen ligase family protein n=1 Tax=Natrarchaeobius chitinivorans TaxID=1679083 RepID=A0A3N6M0Z0_NATCH|nr:O-antigen ligase family protein [Natrarchaeobius chitinivorans]RQG96958.1 O-antigen ligase family protein [Natrarchaeobius chitinivorans]
MLQIIVPDLAPMRYRSSYSIMVCAGILLYIFTEFRSPFGVRYLPFAFLIGQVIIFSLVVAILFYYDKFRFQHKAVPVIGLLIAFVMLSLLSSHWSEYPRLTAQRSLITFLSPVAMIAVVAADRHPKQTFWTLSMTIFSVGTSLSIIGIILYIFGETMVIDGYTVQSISVAGMSVGQEAFGNDERIGSLLHNPNSLAGFLAISLAVSVGLGIKSFPTVFFSGAILQLIALVLTLSRTGFIAAVASLSVITVLKINDEINVGHILKTASVPAVVGVFFLLQSDEADRLTSISFDTRLHIWRPLLSSVPDNPIFGIGFGVSSESILKPAGIEASTHSDYFAILAELGLVGFILFVLLLTSAIGVGVKNYMSTNPHSEPRLRLTIALAVLLSLSLHGAAETTMTGPGYRQVIWAYMLATVINLTQYRE